jgi:hypothetical protein
MSQLIMYASLRKILAEFKKMGKIKKRRIYVKAMIISRNYLSVKLCHFT